MSKCADAGRTAASHVSMRARTNGGSSTIALVDRAGTPCSHPRAPAEEAATSSCRTTAPDDRAATASATFLRPHCTPGGLSAVREKDAQHSSK